MDLGYTIAEKGIVLSFANLRSMFPQLAILVTLVRTRGFNGRIMLVKWPVELAREIL